jgi:hypothetical protein
MPLEIEVTIGTLHLNQSLSAGSDFYLLQDTPSLLSTITTRKSDRDKQGGHGTEDSLSQYGPRTLPFKGEIHASSQEMRKWMEKSLMQAVGLSALQDFAGDDGYRLLLITDEDGIAKQIYAKLVDPPEFELVDTAMSESRKFSFVMYAKDPALYAQELSEKTGPESFLSTTLTVQEGLLPTFRENVSPVIQGAFSASVTAVNAGTFGTPPVMIISGPSLNPRLKNATTGREMDFSAGSGLTLLEGETLTINAGNQTVVKRDAIGAETDESGTLTLTSDWISLDPGANLLTLRDETPDALLGQLSVLWRDAWM